MGLYHFSHLIIFFQYYIKKLIDFYKKYINTVHTMTTRTFLSNSEEKNTNFAMETRILSQFGVTLSDMLWVEKYLQNKKEKMSSIIVSLLKSYKETDDAKVLSGTTFRYIVMYKKTGEVAGRLSVALADFGYTQEEIDKISLGDIVDEIISR